MKLHFLSNEGAAHTIIGLANDFSVLQDDWIQLTPVGDFPHSAGMQRVDQVAVDKMVANFSGLRARFARRFGGVPFFIGHPDHPDPQIANRFTDKKAYGWIMELENRADGLYGRVKWSEPGKALLSNAHYKFFSPFWGAEEVGTETFGGRRTKVFRPVELVSVGLTNEPNIPVLPLSNTKDTMLIPPWLLQLLSLGADATEDQAKTALSNCVNERNSLTTAKTTLANEKSTVETTLANEQTAHKTTRTTLEKERDDAKTLFANERKARITLMLDAGIGEGRITPAQRAGWQTEFETNFDATVTKLANQAPQMNTRGTTTGMGNRKSESDQGAAGAQQQLLSLANEKLDKNPNMGWDNAWKAACAEKPELLHTISQKAAA